MHVAQIEIARFRHVLDAKVGPLGPPGPRSDLVVLAGPNGGGKSSIVDLVAFALTNTWGWNWQVRRSFPNSSFELAFGLSEDDLAQIRTRIADNPALDTDGVFGRLQDERKYYRGFDFPGGMFAADQRFHQAAHQLVTTCLRDRIRGLYLRSDRYYAQRGYDRNQIWNSARRLQSGYLQSIAFTLTEQQYGDQMEFLIEQAYHYPRTVGLHQLRLEEGQDADVRPPNPLDAYNALFQQLFPQYSFARASDELRDQLYINLPDGTEIPFTDLSSGEQEVFFVLTFVLRHDVRDSMIFVDEPELHLHPELARRMVQILLDLRPANQVWLATHNAELIDEAGRDKTYWVSRSAPGSPAQVAVASDEAEHIEQLRSVFGYSGYVGLAVSSYLSKEGDASSPDRRVWVELFASAASRVRLIPINSASTALRINRAALELLSAGIGPSEFFLIRDRDYLSEEQVQAYAAPGRLFVLRRHEIENYLLNADAIAEVMSELLATRTPAASVEAGLHQAAKALVGRVFRDLTTARLNALFQLEDASIGGFEAQRDWLVPDGTWDQAILDAATDRFRETIAGIAARIAERIGPDAVNAILQETASDVLQAVQDGTWRQPLPGKELLSAFGQRAGFQRGPVLANALIRNLAGRPERVDPELRQIVDAIST